MADVLPSSMKLGANSSVGATSITLGAEAHALAKLARWIAIDPFTTECEVRRVTGHSTTTVTFSGALAYAHATDDAVLYLTQPEYPVEFFGAKGDNSTDDTTSIQRAINQAAINSGQVVFGSTYKITSGLTSPGNVRLTGTIANVTENADEGAILSYTPTTGTALTITPSSSKHGPYIENLALVGSGSGHSTIGIYLDGSASYMRLGKLRGVNARNFGTGIKTNELYSYMIEDCYSYGNAKGLYFTNNSNANKVIGGAYRENTTGIHIEGCIAVNIDPTVIIESNTGNGVLVDGAGVQGLTIGGYYENNGGPAIYLNPSAPNYVKYSVIRDAVFASNGTAVQSVRSIDLIIKDLMILNNDAIVIGAACSHTHLMTYDLPNLTDSGAATSAWYKDRLVTGLYQIDEGDGVHIGGMVQMGEFPDYLNYGAPPANTGFIFMEDNGSGKTRLVVRFPTGANQVIATEP